MSNLSSGSTSGGTLGADTAMSLGGGGVLGALAGQIGTVFDTGVEAFSPKVRENRLAIAEANARAAEANAVASQTMNTLDPKIIYGGLAALVLLMVVFFIAKR